MFTQRIKKIIFLISLTLIISGGIGTYIYYTTQNHGPLYNFDSTRDTQAIIKIFEKNKYWLLANPDSSPAFMIKHRTYDSNPLHFGSLHIKVLYEKDKLAGFTAYHLGNSPQEGRILFVAVDHDFRGKGYGKILTECAMKELFAMGVTHIALWTRVENLAAQHIYKGLGFKEIFDDGGYMFLQYWPNK
jgi:ribosomal protein S18 acetylase RimI-like enzyme